MIKILSVGNSFSQDATTLLGILNPDLYVRNLDIGGCSLEKHWRNAENAVKEYVLEEHGWYRQNERVGLKDTLLSEDWDFVTVQQCSALSGCIETYYPYLPKLVEFIRKYTKAKVVFFQTWAYESNVEWLNWGTGYEGQDDMFAKIKAASDYVESREGLPVIRGGEAIQALRKIHSFDFADGGLSLNRDGQHISYNYGRLFLASLWHKFFLGELPEYFGANNLSQPIRELKEVLEVF